MKSIRNGTREISLTRGLVALVDEADYRRVGAVKWFAQRQRNTWYAVSGQRFQRKGKFAQVTMHSFLLGDVAPGLQIDHKDGDGLNNTRANLRIGTLSQNQFNSRLRRDNTSGFKGVQASPPYKDGRKKWRATIAFQGIRQYLGTFSDPIKAARVYDEKAKELFGGFARVNFPGE